MDLNCDVGELKSGQTTNLDHQIMPFISSCNIACGFHSGNPQVIDRTIRAAISNEVRIGAHPSYNDSKNFGRKSLEVDLETLKSELKYQIAALKGMVEYYGGSLNHVKAHGALYNDMLRNKNLATEFVDLVKTIDPNLKILTLAGSVVIEQCKFLGVPYINEGFADRKYQQVTELRSRQFEDAVIHDEKKLLAQVDLFLKGQVQLYNGKLEPLKIDSICLHSDTRGAVALSQKIYNHLKRNKISISAT